VECVIGAVYKVTGRERSEGCEGSNGREREKGGKGGKREKGGKGGKREKRWK
jgi:hypothetical protein